MRMQRTINKDSDVTYKKKVIVDFYYVKTKYRKEGKWYLSQKPWEAAW